MGYPATASARYRPDLQGLRKDFDLEADRMGFIGSRVFPVFEAASSGGAYRKVKVESLLKDAENITRTPGAGYARDTWEFDAESFATEEYGVEETVDDNQKNTYRDLFEMEQVASMRAQDRLLRAYERRVATLAFDQSAFNSASQYTDTTITWATEATATPLADGDTAKVGIRGKCGMWPNAVIMNKRVFMTLRRTAEFRERVASSGAGSSTLASKLAIQQVAEFFDIDQVLIASAATNSAAEGQAATFGELWSSSYVVFARLCTRPGDLEEPCFGRTFHWGGDGSVMEGTVEEYREENVRGNVIRRRHQTDEVRQMIQCAWMLKID